MATKKKKKISELPLATSLVGLFTIGVDSLNRSVKVSLEWLKTSFDNIAKAITDADTATKKANEAAGKAEAATQNTNKATTDANAAEELRAEAETVRKTAEANRIKAETDRIATEILRTEAETNRVDAESGRVTAENTRVTNENARIVAEKKRQTDTSAAIENASTATTNAQNAANRSNALSDHRDKIVNGYWWRWNEETKEWYNTGEIAQGKAVKVLDNGNYAYWDEDTQQYVDSGVEAAATVDIDNIEVAFQEATERVNIESGEKIPGIFGKVKKWFSSLKSLAFKDKADWDNDIENKPTSMPASDVSAWAKAATKPTYTASEVGASASSHEHTWMRTVDNRIIKPAEAVKKALSTFFVGKDGLNGETAGTEYHDLLVFNGYTDASGGKINALALSKKSMSILHYQAAQADAVWGTPKALAYIQEPKAVTLAVASWTQSGEYFIYKITDASLVDKSLLKITPATRTDRDKMIEFEFDAVPDLAIGSFTIYAKKKPSQAININYSILS